MKVRYVSSIIVEMDLDEAQIIADFIRERMVGTKLDSKDVGVLVSLKDYLERETDREA